MRDKKLAQDLAEDVAYTAMEIGMTEFTFDKLTAGEVQKLKKEIRKSAYAAIEDYDKWTEVKPDYLD